MSELSVSEHDGVLVVDSRLIAGRLGIEHRSFLETLDTYESQIEQAFGVLRFETAKPQTGSKGGRPSRYALLNENQATFVMTLSRNTPEVVQCKIELVQAFSRAKELLRQRQPKPEYVPYWYDRMKIAMSNLERPLQRGYFCVYQEIMSFFSELETKLGYLVADINPATNEHLVPDISIGQGFNKFLRSEDELPTQARKHFLGSSELIDFRQPAKRKDGWFEGGKHWKEIEIYNHVYPLVSHGDYQVQPANSYPEKYLTIFRYYLQEYWIPDRCIPYLAERDAVGLTQARKRLMTMSEIERRALSGTLVGKVIPCLPLLPETA